MTFPPIPDRGLTELGRTEGGPATLDLLVRDQDTRRLLMLRAVLDAVESAEAGVCSAGERRRFREDWGLLEEADRTTGTGPAGLAAGPVPAPRTTAEPSTAPSAESPNPPVSPARTRLFAPLTGPWARSCLRGLAAASAARTPGQRRTLRRDLAHFSALAAAAAVRAGIPVTTRLTARDGLLVLPSFGALRTARTGDAPVDLDHRGARLTFRQPGAADVVVHLERGIGAWSAAPAWTPAYALPGLLPSAPPLPLDDLDPYRFLEDGGRHRTLSRPATLDDAERKRWLQAWSGTAAALRLGGEQRVHEALRLLRCLVPLEAPPHPAGGSHGGGSCSATRRESFGAVLSSTPPTPATLAATLVHELQHTKLSALGDMVTLHHAGPEERYFAPWRPDPRPFDGLLQGTYSHLALADFFQRCALGASRPAHREASWRHHAHYREQVAAALPTLVGSPDLTARGRLFVDRMVEVFTRLDDHPAPRGHTARARAYVEAARALWTARGGGHPNG
ncbi:aKG-HExxH-type peptide beta-hydroxylase [Streptomyces echinoruber]|uniref:HEXXH motif domain-containing protein n=1 Tax=Streptomyces echinoruber TaxID=68898 RepID=A0A918V6K9_9ACTN|nr:HEXXH motif-containing putative peptide modification protein [Streptomyces echinoruber]GGZ76174.1 HEXXH motif domain-containing protein [Streptomyces echinoruber]